MEAQFESKCAACGEVIVPGDEIVPDEDGGGWLHEGCSDDPDEEG